MDLPAEPRELCECAAESFLKNLEYIVGRDAIVKG